MGVSEIFSLAAQQAKWLSVRQTAVANNIANANTPGYGAVDVEPFSKVLDDRLIVQAATHNAHFGGASSAAALNVVERDGLKFGGNAPAVKVEEELVKSGEVSHAYNLNTAIVKAFHRMILMTAKV